MMLVLVIALSGSGCTAFSPPERPSYDGVDLVGQVDVESIVGHWTVTPLNPLPGSSGARPDASPDASPDAPPDAPPDVSTDAPSDTSSGASTTELTAVRYRADGTVVANLTAPVDADTTVNGAKFRLVGTWRVDDGSVVHENVVMSTRSQDPSDRLLADMINQSSATARSIADVAELSAEHMIMVGRDGVAMHYARRPY